MASDLQYSLGLDGGSFMSMASRAVSLIGSLTLAVSGLQGAASLMSDAFDDAASMERTATAIGTITKSARLTEAVMRDLRKLAADTPFELSELAPAARALLGAGTATTEVAKQLKTLGDIASGADTDLQGIVSVFNQVRGKGKLLTDDFIQLAERGVAGLREEIAKFEGISTDAVADALSKGAVSAQDLTGVFQRMTSAGGIAFQAMERQSQTFSGKLSTLSDAWNSLQVAFAAPINDALKPVIDDMASLTDMLAPAFGLVGDEIADLVTSAHLFVTSVGSGRGAIESLTLAFGDAISAASDLISIPFGALADAMPDLAAAFIKAIGPVTEWLALKFFTVANDFGATLLNVISLAMEEMAKASPILLGSLQDAAGALSKVAGYQRVASFAGNAAMGQIDLGATMAPAAADAAKAMQVGKESFDERVKAFASSYGLTSPQEKPQGSYDGRYAGESVGKSTMAGLEGSAEMIGTMVSNALAQKLSEVTPPPAAAAATSSPMSSEAVLNELKQITGEMRRINTQ